MNQFPDDETGDALSQFQENGFDMSRPMEVDFFIAVPSEQAGNQLAREAKKLGFNVSVEKDDDSGEWTCYCTKRLVPEYTEIVRIEKDLDNLASSYGGYADGFGSYGNS